MNSLPPAPYPDIIAHQDTEFPLERCADAFRMSMNDHVRGKVVGWSKWLCLFSMVPMVNFVLVVVLLFHRPSLVTAVGGAPEQGPQT